MSDDNSILRDGDLSAISQAVRQTLGRAIEQPKIYRLGKPQPGGLAPLIFVEVDGVKQRGQVWVRNVGEGAGDAVPALNTVLTNEQLIPGDFVEVISYSGSPGLRIIRRAPESAEYSGTVPVRPQTQIDASQLNILLLRPKQPAAMSCFISAGIVELDSTLYHVPGLDTKDFTADIPGSNAIAVYIELDPTDNSLTYTSSSAFSASLTLEQAFTDYLPKTTSSALIPVGYVKLYNGLTSIERENILPARGLINKGGGGSNPFENALYVLGWGYVYTSDHELLVWSGV